MFTTSPSTRAARWAIGCIIVVYILLAVAYSLTSPIYEPTDELRHVRYVRHISVYHRLPVQRTEGPRAQSHHPPLYYALGALLTGWVEVEQDVYYEPSLNPYWGYHYWEVGQDNKNQYVHSADERFPFRGIALVVHLLRWMTVLMGLGVVWITYRLGLTVCPDHPWVAVGAAGLVAFDPQFLYLSGAVNNDILAALVGTATLWVCVHLVRTGPVRRTDIVLGVLYGLALLTKLHLAALAVVIALAYLLAVCPTRDGRALLRGGVTILGLAALIAGWWFWRNYTLYDDPTGMRKVNELWAGRPASENWWAIRQGLPYLWSSLWGRFGYGQIPMPAAVYWGIGGGVIIALIGHLLPRRRVVSLGPLFLLVITPLVFLVVVCYYILIQPAGAMGRFLFPALPAFALLLILGIRRFLPTNSSWDWAAVIIPTVGMLLLALYALLGVLIPAIAPPAPLTPADVAAIPHPMEVQFDDLARLRGYDVTPTAARPGEVVSVTLYWETLTRSPLDYAVFVHLLSDTDTMIAQRDTYPGLGRYPTTAWEPGVIFADTYRLSIPATAYAPDRGNVRVGLYLPDGPRLTTLDGQDTVSLAAVEILPRPGPYPNPLDFNFADLFTLRGYALDRRVALPGETLHLTLYWETRQPATTNYRIFAHILGIENQVWANSDVWPTPPTTQWQPGAIVTQTHDLTIGLTTPPGGYTLEIGIYEPEGDRLPILAPDGHWLDNRALLGTIRVGEK